MSELGTDIIAEDTDKRTWQRRWGKSLALFTDDTVIEVEVPTPADRPSILATDQAVAHNPVRVRFTRAADRHVRLAFNPEHRLDERIGAEQFPC